MLKVLTLNFISLKYWSHILWVDQAKHDEHSLTSSFSGSNHRVKNFGKRTWGSSSFVASESIRKFQQIRLNSVNIRLSFESFLYKDRKSVV